MTLQYTRSSSDKLSTKQQMRSIWAALGLVGLVTGCNAALAQSDQAGPPVSFQTPPPLPTLRPTPTQLAAPSILSPLPAATPRPTLTPWPTPTPWPIPAAWQPKLTPLPTLAPVPISPTGFTGGNLPFSYSPPDGVDVFGSTVLRWTYSGILAEDEFFDIRLRPAGSNASVFVDWSKSPEYLLQPWSGWQPGLYTWQIGIVRGNLEGSTKHFIADTGRDSQPLLIKWQAGGGGGGGSSSSGGGGGRSGGS